MMPFLRQFVKGFAGPLRQARVLCLLGGLALVAGCMPQLIKSDAQELARNGEYEKSLAGLKEGLAKYPDNTELKAAYLQAEDDINKRLLAQAQSHIALGQHEQAKDVLLRLQRINPSAPRLVELQKEIAASQATTAQLQRAERLLDESKPAQAAQVLEGLPGLAGSQYGLAARMQSLQSRLDASLLGPDAYATNASKMGRFVNASTVSFDFRAAPVAAVLEALRKDTDLNFVLDRDVKVDTRITMFVKNARVDDALDLVLSAAQLARRVLDAKTVLIYPNTPEKVREHEELMVKVFRLNHVEARATAAMLKTMIKAKEPFVDERANSIMLRDSPEVVAIAEQLIAMHDVNEGELMLEIEVLEVKRSRLTEIGMNFPNSFTVGPAKASGWVGLTGNWWNDYKRGLLEVGAGNLLGNFKREVGDFSVLANPKLRVKSREKAKILIGDKVPVVTTTTATSGAVSDNISYLDVGIKLDAEPTISPNNEILLKIGLEVSTLAKEVRTTSGALAYQIGTRNANTVLRLRDGETQLLGGLISNEDRSSSNRVPGLGDIPLVGRLFSSQKDDVQTTELVLAVTPRLIRAVADEPITVRQIGIGTEGLPRMRQPYPQRERQEEAAPTQQTSIANKVGTAKPAPLEPQRGELTLAWQAPSSTKLGELTQVILEATIPVATRGLPMEITYSPKSLEILDVSEAGLFREDDGTVGFTKSVNVQEGRIGVGLLRSSGKGLKGKGALLRIQFKAREPGSASFKVNSLKPIGETGLVQAGTLPSLSIQVLP